SLRARLLFIQGMNVIMNNSGNFSLLDHQLIPHHMVLSEKEAAQVLKEFSSLQPIEKEQLPKIKSTDPVIMEIGAKVGDIIKIIRKSQTAGEGEFYRLVIE
ncbi:DNA-directed RNA polymerase subunit H, partial [Candidatus Methanomarinus sp.]